MQLVSELPTKAEAGQGLDLCAIEAVRDGNTWTYEHVTVELDETQRVVNLTMRAPATPQPTDAAGYLVAGNDSWALRCFRELDDAILHLRLEHAELGLILLRTRGSVDAILEVEKTLVAHQTDWFVNEVIRLMARVLVTLTLRWWRFIARSTMISSSGSSTMVGACPATRHAAPVWPIWRLGRVSRAAASI